MTVAEVVVVGDVVVGFGNLSHIHLCCIVERHIRVQSRGSFAIVRLVRGQNLKNTLECDVLATA